MFFDLQFSEEKFLELLTDQVQRALPLVDDAFNDPLDPNEKLVIDHLDVTGIESEGTVAASISIATPAGPTNINGNKVRIKINITAKLTTRQNAINAGHLNAPAIKRSFGIWVRADISASASAGQINLAIMPIEVGDVLNVLGDTDKQALLAKMPSLDRALPLPDVAGEPLNVSNAGITTHGGVIAILAELSAPSASTKTSWENFFNGLFVSRPGDWSIQLPPELIVGIVDRAITDAVDAIPKDDQSVEVVSEPSTSWAIDGVVSTATINAIDACPVFASDIEADLNFLVTFSLEGGAIKVTIDVSWDLNDWDVFVCGLATVVLPGAVVTLLAGAIFGPVGAVIAAVATIIVFIVALVKISDAAHGKLSDGVSGIDPGDMNLHTVSQDDDHAVIEGSVKLGQLMSGMTPTSVAATPTGLLISGTLDVPVHQERSLHIVGQNGFDWDAGYSCSSFSYGVDQIEASVGITEPANYPVLAKAEVLTQPATAYKPSVKLFAPVTGFSVTVHSNLPPATGPDCELLLWSNSGLRYAKFAHLPALPKPPSPEELIEAKIGCMKQSLPGPKQWLEAHWLIDPPPYETVLDRLHLWDVVTSKLEPGVNVEVAIVGARGDVRTIAKIPAGANGQAAFRFVTKHGQSIAVRAERGMEHMGLFRGGVALEPVARMVPYARALSATVSGVGNQARVQITTADEVMHFGIGGQFLGHEAIAVSKSLAAAADLRAAQQKVITALPSTMTNKAMALSAAGAPIGAMTHFAAEEAHVSGSLREVSTALFEGRRSEIDLRPTSGRARWLAEPWMQTPIRVGNLAARIENGGVTVYQYVQKRVF